MPTTAGGGGAAVAVASADTSLLLVLDDGDGDWCCVPTSYEAPYSLFTVIMVTGSSSATLHLPILHTYLLMAL